MTCRCAFSRFRWHCSPFWVWNPPKTPNLGAWIGVFKPNRQNIESFVLSKLLHRFRPNFAQQWSPEWWGVGMVICLERGADLHMFQLMPLPLTVSCFSKIQIGFSFLVAAHLGSPGERAVKRVNGCVMEPIKWSSSMVPIGAQQIQDGGRPPFWKNR